MINSFSSKIILRKKIVLELTSEIIKWSFNNENSFSINKLACFASSNLADYFLFNKKIFDLIKGSKVVSKVELSLTRNLKKKSIFLNRRGWTGSYTNELRSLIISNPSLLVGGINFKFNYEYLKYNYHSRDLGQILKNVVLILINNGIDAKTNELPQEFLNFLIQIKYFFYKTKIIDTGIDKSLDKLSSIYLSEPWETKNYILRKYLQFKNIESIWLPHGTAGYNFNTQDEILAHLVWLGMGNKLYSNKKYSLQFTKSLSNLNDIENAIVNPLVKTSSIKFASKTKNAVGIVIFPLGDLNSYPHYHSNTFFQVRILKKLLPFFINLNKYYKLYFLIHPSITSYYMKWIKDLISENLEYQFYFGTFDEFTANCKNIIFTYMGTSTFHRALILKKNILFLSFSNVRKISKKNILIDSKYKFSEVYLPLDSDNKEISDYLITQTIM